MEDRVVDTYRRSRTRMRERGHVTGQAIHDPGSRTASPVIDGVDPSPEGQPPKDDPAA